ncbi:F-box domain containing protein [Tanacetum coccineum]
MSPGKIPSPVPIFLVVIPPVPCCPIAGKALYANGFLFWLTSFTDRPTQDDGGRDVIWFDMKTNEFRSISRPITICGHPKMRSNCFYDHLVDLNGQAGFVCIRTMEIWLLNHEKEWLLHCRINNHDHLPDGYINVIGYLNKDQDILIKVSRSTITPTCGASEVFFVYRLKSGVLHEVKIIGRETQCRATTDIIMYPKSLFSIHDINTDFHLIKKTHSKRCGFLS